ncbi:protein NRT1/ PTR FAMILY 5.10-like [Silene latifolia]|uniref:protein NRT1/ PTR FAMILY 5.10-like n=1 Tax=Silene latifolia TaxID=37657 RepID=UPI003D76BF6E
MAAMVNSSANTTDSSQCDSLCPPLLLPLVVDDTVAAAVDYKKNPAIRSKTGRWRSAAFIIGVATAELIVDSGVQGNLINFLTGELGESIVTAAANLNAWAGVAYLLPIFGAVIADSYLGKYSTVIAASLLYILQERLIACSKGSQNGVQTPNVWGLAITLTR